jgi:hypothetical protein
LSARNCKLQVVIKTEKVMVLVGGIKDGRKIINGILSTGRAYIK